MSYAVKELFYTLQGEGANVGRPAVENPPRPPAGERCHHLERPAAMAELAGTCP
jgi:hypothetical protein